MPDPIDRDRLAATISEMTPLTLDQFEFIHGPVIDRRAAWDRILWWRGLKAAFPAATVWKIYDASPPL